MELIEMYNSGEDSHRMKLCRQLFPTSPLLCCTNITLYKPFLAPL